MGTVEGILSVSLGVVMTTSGSVVPGEIEDPANTAEAFDSMDFECAPNIRFDQNDYGLEKLTPGWHAGPYCDTTGGWAALNGARHPSSPNILYADGHVSADATKVLEPRHMGSAPNGNWSGIRLNSWDDFDPQFGTMRHIVVETKFTNGW